MASITKTGKVRKANVRTIVNRQALDSIREDEVRAIEDLVSAVIAQARPPDAPPLGQGLVATGDWGVWADGKKVAGSAPKPRSVRVKQFGVIGIGGFGFPGRFQEMGTIKMSANPFLTPAFVEVFGNNGHIGFLRKRLSVGGKQISTRRKGF